MKIFDGVGKMVEREAWGMMPSALVVCRQQLARGCQGPKVVEAIALVWNRGGPRRQLIAFLEAAAVLLKSADENALMDVTLCVP